MPWTCGDNRWFGISSPPPRPRLAVENGRTDFSLIDASLAVGLVAACQPDPGEVGYYWLDRERLSADGALVTRLDRKDRRFT